MCMVKIIAHRGYVKNYPENTLPAFKAALAYGADAIELDVHQTHDGELAVYHDYYLNDSVISDLSLQEVKAANKSIPTLAEVFELIGDKLHYEIELKGFTEDFLRKVLALASSYRLLNVIEFTSPHPYILSRIKQLEPACKTGIFVVLPPDWMGKTLCQTLAINNALLGSVNVLHCPLKVIDNSFIKTAHAQNLLVHAANCNTAEALSTAFKLQVDQLSTDNLELLKFR